ncbi:MAG: ammonia-forming cytochrome c nitrite reductase subunit c552, partial [Sedimentisphaerales bacterium]|nr:ammonia-forming cytochrome c nitrite reductase subunit c552 [Sedimentisphaerales bacterium]
LDCMHCHTSSGRYRFTDPAKANRACLPCHQERVDKVFEHSHHPPDGDGNTCIGCHMPMTKFARMNRTDHSMRPPTPAATIAYKSPNACNLCHNDQDASWSDEQVRQWHTNDYQKPVMQQARLIQAARDQDWSLLDEMLGYIQADDHDEVFAVSLIRLLRVCDSDKKWPVLINALKENKSPLARAAAAEALDGYLTGDSATALLDATIDKYRLVRVRAAGALAPVQPERLRDETYRDNLKAATNEYMAALNAHLDDDISHYNLGNFYSSRGDYQQAIKSYQNAIRLRPDNIMPLVNIAFAYNATGQNKEAEKSFRRALQIEPGNAAVYVNLGMLLGEVGKIEEAHKAFEKVLELDPNSAVAAYNLGVILAKDNPNESLRWSRKAYQLDGDEPKYAYTYAFYLYQSGMTEEAIEILQQMIDREVPYPDAYFMLGKIYEQKGQLHDAMRVYTKGAGNEKIPENQRRIFSQWIKNKQEDE